MNATATRDTTVLDRIRTYLSGEEKTPSVQALMKELDQKAGGAVRRAKGNGTPGAAPKRGRPKGSVNRPKGAPPMTTVPTAPPRVAGANAPTLDQVLSECAELGRVYGHGKDAQIKFDLKVIEAAYAGVLSLQKDKHGPERDDAVKLAEAYVTANNQAVIFDHKAPNQSKLCSVTRLWIKWGTSTKYGTGEPQGVTNKFNNLWLNLRKQPANRGQMNDAHNALGSFVRTQLKRDTLMDETEMRDFCFKKVRDQRTGEEVLEALQKRANLLAEGKLPNCPDRIPEAKKISAECTKLLTNIAKARGAATRGQTAAA